MYEGTASVGEGRGMVHTMSAMQADTGVAERIVGRGGRSTYTNESISKERKF